jgi:hypothetical protein
MKPLRENRQRIALTLLCLTIYGCCSSEVIRLKPPDVLLQPCQASGFTGQTYGDLVHYSIGLRETLELCNQDKAAIRQWANEQ